MIRGTFLLITYFFSFEPLFNVKDPIRQGHLLFAHLSSVMNKYALGTPSPSWTQDKLV